MNPRIQELIEESIKSPPDSGRDNELVALLKEGGGPVAVEILKEMADRKSPNTFRVAWSVLDERAHAEPFFAYVITNTDASTIEYWLRFALSRVGLAATIRVLKSKESEVPGILEKALYWLPGLVGDKDRMIVEDLKRAIKT